MSEFTVIDKKGVWVTVSGDFPLPDYQRHNDNPGTELVVLQPGMPTKIELNDFLRAQANLQILTVDPVTGEEIAPAGESKTLSLKK